MTMYSRLPLAACELKRDDEASYYLVPLITKRVGYIYLGPIFLSVFSFIFFSVGTSCQYRYDSQAFLFSLVNKPGWAPVKLPQKGQHHSLNRSIRDCPTSGPTFGPNDFQIADYASGGGSNTNLGHTYSPPSGYNYGDTFSYTFLHGGSGYFFTPDEVEVFYETA